MNRIAAAVFVFLLTSAGAFAQTTPAWGIASEIAYPVFPQDLDPSTSAVQYGYSSTGRYLTASGGSFSAGLRLPTGALILRFEADLCDNSSTGEMTASLVRSDLPFGGGLILGSVATGIVFSDGLACGTFSATLAAPELVDNETRMYYVTAANAGSFGSSTRVSAIRVYYRLQISPAPATARFDDVPTTHPFFQFIEALAASGITGGCNATPPQYCPNDFVTRGQMAAFLARALGLHWAP